MCKNFISFMVFIAAFLVVSSAYAQSPYISRVWEYCPAPGQFVNSMPEYEDGDDADDMRIKADEAIVENNRGMISLGGWGGYVTFGFDHMVVNRPNANDLLVLGNAFVGSSEPGIVMVSYDANGNGKPDDQWYELAGSEYTNPQTIHDYSVTYRRLEAGDQYPKWLDEDSMTFTGSRLPDNYEDQSGEGTYYVLYAYPYGYVDNHPNTDPKAQLDIDWAVDAAGNPVSLPGIHFVKVYTALHQQCGWLGETSTEIMGAEDLGMTTVGMEETVTGYGLPVTGKRLVNGQLYIIRNKQTYSLTGTIIQQ